MKSLTDISSEYKCHQNFYRMVWGDLTILVLGKSMHLYGAGNISVVLEKWENRHNNPNLFYNEDSYFKKACSELFD